MKKLTPTFEEFINEETASQKQIRKNIDRLAKDLGGVLDKKESLFSKELDDYAKDLFSKKDLELYHKYRAIIIDEIAEDMPNVEIKD